ncbi:hypothetical protein NMG60_11000269 [Bertholletia excelsa]
MATNPDATISVSIMVDEQKNRVIWAEAGNDFVDALFSFLTLPMGTIIRLLRDLRQQSTLPATDLGCLSNLYRSVETLGSDHLWTDACEDMLLRPRNPRENFCNLLKVNVDDTKPKYFICPNADCFGKLSYYANARCRCGMTTDRELTIDCGSTAGSQDGVFLWGSTVYIVHDDLKVTTRTPTATVKLLNDLGITNINCIRERVLTVGLKDILILLERSLLSKTPLTDVFLTNERKLRVPPEDYQFVPCNISERKATSVEIVVVKILVKKSTGKVLYAEAKEDFVDLLFSFLTIPLGSVITCLSRDSSLGCVDNLYKSVESLDDKWFVEHSPLGDSSKMSPQEMKQYLLLNPGLTPKFGCSSQPFGLKEKAHRVTFKKRGRDVYSLIFHNNSPYFPGYTSSLEGVVAMDLVDPKEPSGRSGSGGFVKRPAEFQVYDDLAVLSSSIISSSVSFLKGLGEGVGAAMDDIEEHVIKITKQEALNLLKASLITKSALTTLLKHSSKKIKEEHPGEWSGR